MSVESIIYLDDLIADSMDWFAILFFWEKVWVGISELSWRLYTSTMYREGNVSPGDFTVHHLSHNFA